MSRPYVGKEANQRILSSDVRRGKVLRIRAAILFADMRRQTELTSGMTKEAATDLVAVIKFTNWLSTTLRRAVASR